MRLPIVLATATIPIFATALALTAMTATARAEDLDDGTGSLPGGAFAAVGLDLGFFSGEAVLPRTNPAPQEAPTGVTELSGIFGTARVKAGGYLRVTRFGSEVGLEGTFGIGLAGAGAIDPAGDSNLMIDMSGGINAALFRLEAGHLALKLAAGIGLDQDSEFLYAGGRVSLDPSPTLGVEAAYTYHLGDTAGEDATWKDHAIGATVVLKSLGIGIGAEYRIGSAHKYAAASGSPSPGVPATPAIELPQKDQLWKGDYSAFVINVSYYWF